MVWKHCWDTGKQKILCKREGRQRQREQNEAEGCSLTSFNINCATKSATSRENE